MKKVTKGFNKMQKKQRGFSLLELIIVLVLVGVITSFAVPSFESTTQRNAVRKITNQLESDLKLARIEALSRGVKVTLCPSEDITVALPVCAANWNNFTTAGSGNGQRGWMVYQQNATSTNGPGAADDLIKLGEYNDVNGKAVLTVDVNSFTFTRKGTGNAGTFKVGRENASKPGTTIEVTVAPTGRVSNDSKQARGK